MLRGFAIPPPGGVVIRGTRRGRGAGRRCCKGPGPFHPSEPVTQRRTCSAEGRRDFESRRSPGGSRSRGSG
eukprot:1030219-Alexandrium_andersonii.AAC.1